MKRSTKKDQYSIFNNTRNNPITLMAPSMLPILNFEIQKWLRLSEHALRYDMLSMLVNTYKE